ncbi:MAG: arylsulfatase [Armatimonadetes bacterium]|nr:arylsulfatase [Armatimonadota bacterium]
MLLAAFALSATVSNPAALPNIIYIMADDLGYGEVGAYGQTKIKTPNIDRIAAEGIKFSQHYSGSTVCAPSRCVLLTGKHTGHSYIRDNSEIGGWGEFDGEGQEPLPDDTFTIGRMLQEKGYATAAIGKWGLGGPGTSGAPNNQGFDYFFGYLCQRRAHNYYPKSLWENDTEVFTGNGWFDSHQKLAGDPTDPASYAPFQGKDYAPDMMADRALKFIQDNKDRPFFLYFATPVPHAALQVPNDSLAQYSGQFDTEPYVGDRGYLPHMEPRAAYAAMVTRMDRDIGRMLDLLDSLGLANNTLVVFTSDNGPTFNGGTDSEFFNSTAGLRGLKTSLYEGGIRVPMVARWPGKIAPGSETDHVSAFWDVLPTLAEIVSADVPADVDGLSFLPTLTGGEQASHDFLYWEFHGRKSQAVRFGDYKAIRLYKQGKPEPIEIYNLAKDVAESNDLAASRPELVAQAAVLMERRFRSHRTRWNFD